MRILKVGDTIYENYEIKKVYPVFDENGEIKEFKEGYEIDINKLKDYVKDTIIWLEKQKVQKKLNEHGYFSEGDLIVYQNEDTAQNLLRWYKMFDERIWGWIENELPKKSNEELLDVDLISLIESFGK